jgi:hypothetical protein
VLVSSQYVIKSVLTKSAQVDSDTIHFGYRYRFAFLCPIQDQEGEGTVTVDWTLHLSKEAHIALAKRVSADYDRATAIVVNPDIRDSNTLFNNRRVTPQGWHARLFHGLAQLNR